MMGLNSQSCCCVIKISRKNGNVFFLTLPKWFLIMITYQTRNLFFIRWNKRNAEMVNFCRFAYFNLSSYYCMILQYFFSQDFVIRFLIQLSIFSLNGAKWRLIICYMTLSTNDLLFLATFVKNILQKCLLP